jgi:predicted nucleic acid-binding protein
VADGLSFFDTNVLIYAVDASAPDKRRKALALWKNQVASSSAVISLQVMQEYYNTATRKLGIDPGLARQQVEVMSRVNVVRFKEQDVLAAIDIQRLSGISFWDAMIVHAAVISGARILYSEDLQHALAIRGIHVINPFL